ncbi:MAG: hypothetical protein GTO63_18425 [Anaerolineae bacterium]|nr:hypothetical protein [Anaerolineae bacterium]NIN96746.1 hypothetical protein [Anaerolineae bacterium]NIQ79742.1 hypothetical protein [Anaerolineae bacterium]
MSQRMVVSEDHLYEVLAFLFSSAHLLVNEPHLYGTFRLIDGASRLIGFALEGGQLSDEQFLRQLKEDVDEKKFLLMTDEETYFQLLADATRDMAREMKSRAAATEGES